MGHLVRMHRRHSEAALDPAVEFLPHLRGDAANLLAAVPAECAHAPPGNPVLHRRVKIRQGLFHVGEHRQVRGVVSGHVAAVQADANDVGVERRLRPGRQPPDPEVPCANHQCEIHAAACVRRPHAEAAKVHRMTRRKVEVAACAGCDSDTVLLRESLQVGLGSGLPDLVSHHDQRPLRAHEPVGRPLHRGRVGSRPRGHQEPLARHDLGRHSLGLERAVGHCQVDRASGRRCRNLVRPAQHHGQAGGRPATPSRTW